MEVHHHSHTVAPPDSYRDHRGRKKWTHYFWEFLMLFLAVFCGFLAENQREHLVEHRREKQYIRSLISDIKTDTANITRWLLLFNRVQKSCDTVLENFDGGINLFSVPFANNYSSVVSGFPDFIYTDRTMQQLKNAGGMRMIKKAPASDSIIDYDAYVRYVLIQETEIASYFDQLNSLTNKIFSYRKFTNQFKLKSGEDAEKINFWITHDPVQFEQLYNLFYRYRLIIGTYSHLLFQLKNKGVRLIGFLQQEYHLK